MQEFWRVNLWIGVIFLLMVRMEGNELSLDSLANVTRLFTTVRLLSFILASLTTKISIQQISKINPPLRASTILLHQPLHLLLQVLPLVFTIVILLKLSVDLRGNPLNIFFILLVHFVEKRYFVEIALCLADYIRNKWRLQLLCIQFWPFYLFEKGVLLQLLSSVFAQSLSWVLFQQLVDQRNQLRRQLGRELKLRQTDFPIHQFLSDLAPCLASIWPLTKCQLEEHNTQRIVIRLKRKIPAKEDLWRHVNRSATGFTLARVILLRPKLSNSKICQPYVSVFLEKNVLWFDIPVYHIIGMDVFQSKDKTRGYESFVKFILTYLFLIKMLLIADVVSQVCSSDVIHRQKKVGIVLEGVCDVDNERVVEMAEDDSFIQHGTYIAFLQNSILRYWVLLLRYLFQSVLLSSLLICYLPHPTKRTKSNLIIELVILDGVDEGKLHLTVSFAHLEGTIGLCSIDGVLSSGVYEVFRPVVGDCLFQFLF